MTVCRVYRSPVLRAPEPPSPTLGGSGLGIQSLSHHGLVCRVGQGSQMVAYFVPQESVSTVDEEVTVFVASERVGTPRGKRGSQAPVAVILLIDSDHLHMVYVDPRAVTKPLPLRHGT